MNFLDKLERKYRRYAITNLMLYISMGQVIVFALDYLFHMPIVSYIYFDLRLILKGEVWRLFTFAFFPNASSAFMQIIAAYVYYSLGSSLENHWGTFKFNVYYFVGLFLNMLAMILIDYVFHIPSVFFASYTTLFLNLSLFLAFATLFPDLTFLLAFLIPIKAKYLAIIEALYMVYMFIESSTATRILIVFSLLHFLIFFFSHIRGVRPTMAQRDFRTAQQDSMRRELKQGPPIKVAFHKCSVCGKTELTDPDMEFRYCSKCNGNHEYCMEHLPNHEHKQ